jgi:molybdopterin-guanine dinucleotide biosynthesis protein A
VARAWDRFGWEATDPVAGEGPLRGLLTALDAAATAVVVVTTVDMPAVTLAQLAWLVEQLDEGDLGVMLQRATDGGPQLEPFPLVVRTTAADTVRARLADGRRSLNGLARESRFAVRAAPPEWPAEAWTNLNTPEDLARYDRQSSDSPSDSIADPPG